LEWNKYTFILLEATFVLNICSWKFHMIKILCSFSNLNHVQDHICVFKPYNLIFGWQENGLAVVNKVEIMFAWLNKVGILDDIIFCDNRFEFNALFWWKEFLKVFSFCLFKLNLKRCFHLKWHPIIKAGANINLISPKMILSHNILGKRS